MGNCPYIDECGNQKGLKVSLRCYEENYVSRKCY